MVASPTRFPGFDVGMIGVMSTANTRPDPAPPPDAEMAAARAARQALAAQQLRHAAGRWPTSDQITILGQQLVRSIDRYERLHRQPPTWADAFAGVDPSLLTPLQAAPDGWPYKPAHWRRELRQHLMTELRKDQVYHLHPHPTVPTTRRPGPRLAPHHPPHRDDPHAAHRRARSRLTRQAGAPAASRRTW